MSNFSIQKLYSSLLCNIKNIIHSSQGQGHTPITSATQEAGTGHEDQAGLKHKDLPVSVPQAPGLKACATMPSPTCQFGAGFSHAVISSLRDFFLCFLSAGITGVRARTKLPI